MQRDTDSGAGVASWSEKSRDPRPERFRALLHLLHLLASCPPCAASLHPSSTPPICHVCSHSLLRTQTHPASDEKQNAITLRTGNILRRNKTSGYVRNLGCMNTVNARRGHAGNSTPFSRQKRTGGGHAPYFKKKLNILFKNQYIQPKHLHFHPKQPHTNKTNTIQFPYSIHSMNIKQYSTRKYTQTPNPIHLQSKTKTRSTNKPNTFTFFTFLFKKKSATKIRLLEERKKKNPSSLQDFPSSSAMEPHSAGASKNVYTHHSYGGRGVHPIVVINWHSVS
ncbi:hypothetical protein SKAU_G00301540 [Synaphobranchus kaupii]|uniref:Uncharacterized protein n=1 Tax=Synaphobranchus kaupii TaxID=118154 RepID=A0A9Q1EVV2_SYNKA|nr:hypothetical protein SKAU_G00301540 [Synaphobranchus kaupii]